MEEVFRGEGWVGVATAVVRQVKGKGARVRETKAARDTRTMSHVGQSQTQ